MSFYGGLRFFTIRFSAHVLKTGAFILPIAIYLNLVIFCNQNTLS